MIEILIIAHGDLGSSFVQCASHIMGKKPVQLMHLRISAGDDPDAILAGALKLVGQLDSGSGVLVLSDICGATPCNIGSRLVRHGRVECLAGVNLPILHCRSLEEFEGHLLYRRSVLFRSLSPTAPAGFAIKPV